MTETKKQTVLYIDGQNFMTRIRTILRRRGVTEIDLSKFDFWGMLGKIFKDQQVDLVQIYFAKLHAHKDTAEKSEELIKRELELKALLEQQGLKYITAGSVRPRKRGDEIEFVEKGVDIRIAVDMVTDVIDGVVSTVLLASSDSDMQPAIYEMKRRGAEVWYVGFASRMNRGLMLTTDRYVLIDNMDIVKFYSPDARPASPAGRRETSDARDKIDKKATPEPQVKSQAAQRNELPAEQPIQLRNQRVTTIPSVQRPKLPAPRSGDRYRVAQPSKPVAQPQKPVVAPPSAQPEKQDTEFNVPPWTRKNI